MKSHCSNGGRPATCTISSIELHAIQNVDIKDMVNGRNDKLVSAPSPQLLVGLR